MSVPDGASPTSAAESRQQLLALIRGYRMSQVVYVAAALGIPDLLAEGPRQTGELARASDAHESSLRRLLRALVGVGVVDKVGPDRFALGPLGAALRTDVPGSVRPSVLFLLNESHWRPWGHLLHSVRTGETAFDHVHGTGLFDYLERNPEEAALFNRGMAGNSPAHARLVVRAYDFSGMTKVVDVGGGRGRLIATILEEHGALRGILFDRPHVVESARQTLAETDVAHRCELVGGSFFDAVPAGGDVYVLRNIIHDWQDEQAIAILRTCRRAMAHGARLVLVERHLPDDPREALLVLHADLEMLVNVGGLERTTDEYAELLGRSGFQLSRTIPLGQAAEAMGHYLVEARPI
jgi:hypothetical protein